MMKPEAPTTAAVGSQLVRGVRLHVALVACLVVVGCDDGKPSIARGTARTALFKECMELAAKLPRQSDDDVADVVNACGQQSWYMTNHLP